MSRDYAAEHLRLCANPDRLVRNLYAGLKYRSNHKRHQKNPPKLCFSLKEFEEWIWNNGYKKLHKEYLESGQKKSDKPSVDRVDCDKDYTIDNIQLVTWKVNDKKGAAEKGKRVNQICDGVIVNSFDTCNEAGRHIGKKRGNGIQRCCEGATEEYCGYNWEYE